MKTMVAKNGGILLHSFEKADMDFLQQHCQTTDVSLWLEGTALPNLDFLLVCQNITDLSIYGGKVGDYSALARLENLSVLFLNGRLRRWLTDFSFLSDLQALKILKICNYPLFASFPNLENLQQLSEVSLNGCKRLWDISNVLKIPHLKKFGIVDTPQRVEDLECIAQKNGIQQMSGAFGSKKRDAAFYAMLQQYGLTYG